MPACAVKLCKYSELGYSAVTDWIGMFGALRSDLITGNGLGKWCLEQSDGLTGEVLQLFLELNQALHDHREKERKQRAQR